MHFAVISAREFDKIRKVVYDVGENGKKKVDIVATI